MWGPRMLSSEKLGQEQVKRVLRESPVLLLRSPRRNRRISLAFREVLLPGSGPATRTAGTVCVSVLLSSRTAFSAQYDSVLAVCCHLLIGSARIVWTWEVGVSAGVLLPEADARTEAEEKLNLKSDFCKEILPSEGVWQVLMSAVGQWKQDFPICPFGGNYWDPD